MPWWAWIVVGAILLGSELAFIDAQFYLVFCGAAAALLGVLGLAGVIMPDWLQWLIFAALSIAFLVFFRRRIYDAMRKQSVHMEMGPAGEHVRVPIDLAAGASCRLEYRGTTWTAQNTSEHDIAADSQARIVNVDGLTLQIRPIKHSHL
jgi:membrane protein implicated in regulation of membrane protease activity